MGEGDVSGLVRGDRIVATPHSDPSGTWYVVISMYWYTLHREELNDCALHPYSTTTVT